MWRVRTIMVAVLSSLMLAACSTSGAINRGEAKDDGAIRVGIVLKDMDKSTPYNTPEMIAMDKAIVSGIENIPNIRHAPVNECEYLVSVVKITNPKLNRALNLNYMTLAYSLVHFKSKSEVQEIYILPKSETNKFAVDTLIPHLTKFILQTDNGKSFFNRFSFFSGNNTSFP